MNNMNKPKIRFKGFTDDWEQRKLGDLYTERNERGNGSLQILSVSIHTGVSDGELDVDNLGKFVRRSEDKSTYKHVHSGDLIFNMMRAWQGAIGVAKTEGMISPAYISAIPSEDIYPPFMNYLLRRKDVINQINNLSYGVTDFRKRLYWNSFVQVNCKLPSVEEQRNITDVFEKIDHLITLHQRKYEKLQIIKKSMLENCFPKNGEKVPKIRFSGFTGDWEQRKFSELYAKSSEKNDGSIDMDRNITVATMQFKDDVKVSTAEYLKTYYTFNLGDIAFEGHQSKEFRFGRFVENDIGNGIVSHIFTVFRPITEFDLQFWKYAINNEMLMQQILSRSTKASTMMHDLVIDDFLNETFLVPSLDEQKQIGACLYSLDHLITLHQSELEKLQKIKKSLLERMFV